jgi:hypothetical protein
VSADETPQGIRLVGAEQPQAIEPSRHVSTEQALGRDDRPVADGQAHVVSSRELEGDLPARGPTTHDEYPSLRHLLWVPVRISPNLQDTRRQLRGKWWDDAALECAGGHQYCAARDRATSTRECNEVICSALEADDLFIHRRR